MQGRVVGEGQRLEIGAWSAALRKRRCCGYISRVDGPKALVGVGWRRLLVMKLLILSEGRKLLDRSPLRCMCSRRRG